MPAATKPLVFNLSPTFIIMSLRNKIKAIQSEVGTKADGVFGPVTASAVLDHIVNQTSIGETVSSAKDYKFDSRTEKNLASLSASAQKKFRPFTAQAQAIAASMGYQYTAISGNRTYAEQNALYAKGRTKPGRKVTNARGGYSNHNFGLALDFGVFKGGKYLDGSSPKEAHRVHAAVAQVAAKHGIEWGGNWRSFKDTPHYQVKVNMTMAQMRAAVKAGRKIT